MVNPSACRLLAAHASKSSQMPSKAALRLSSTTSLLARSASTPRTFSSYRMTGSSVHNRLPYLSSYKTYQNALCAKGIRQFGTTTAKMVGFSVPLLQKEGFEIGGFWERNELTMVMWNSPVLQELRPMLSVRFRSVFNQPRIERIR